MPVPRKPMSFRDVAEGPTLPPRPAAPPPAVEKPPEAPFARASSVDEIVAVLEGMVARGEMLVSKTGSFSPAEMLTRVRPLVEGLAAVRIAGDSFDIHNQIEAALIVNSITSAAGLREAAIRAVHTAHAARGEESGPEQRLAQETFQAAFNRTQIYAILDRLAERGTVLVGPTGTYSSRDQRTQVRQAFAHFATLDLMDGSKVPFEGVDEFLRRIRVTSAYGLRAVVKRAIESRLFE